MATKQEEQKDPHSLKGVMEKIHDTGLFSDVAVLVGVEKHRFNAHKVILGGRSPVLEAMMQKRWVEKCDADGIILLSFRNHGVEAFRLFLRYLYTDELGDVSIGNCVELMKMAHLYDVPPLLTLTTDRIRLFIHQCGPAGANICLQIYRDVRHIDHHLGQSAFQHFLNNIRIAAEKNQYLKWEADLLRKILTQEALKVREVDLFKALMNWGNQYNGPNDTISRPDVMPELLRLIRFPVMSIQQFAEEVIPRNALSKDEILKMFIHYSSPDSAPSGFDSCPRHLRTQSILANEDAKDVDLNGAVRTGFCPISSHGLSQEFISEIPPDIRIVVEKPVCLLGVGIFSVEIQQYLTTGRDVHGHFDLEAIVKRSDQSVVAKGNSPVYRGCDRARSVVTIQFDTPLLLRANTGYNFYVTCTEKNERTRLTCRGEPYGTGIQHEEIELRDGSFGTITHFGRDFEGTSTPQTPERMRSCWIRHLVVGKVPEEPRPCIIS